MNSKDTFSSYHPIINFLYFALILLFSMCFMNPLCLGISFVCSIVYHCRLAEKKAVRFTMLYMLPLILITAIVNPAFTHQGFTILAYLPNGNPITLESILYGIAAAFMLASVLEWFACYTQVMTSDKFVYLFGKIIPALSLVLSMTLRFVPKFSAQFQQVAKTQKSIGRDTSTGTVFQRIRNGVTILSIMITWSLENAIETADSMKSRGYGLPGRSAFSIYRFDDRDKGLLLWLLACGFFILCGWKAGVFTFVYYPRLRYTDITPFTAVFYLAYLFLCLTPVILDRREEKVWKKLKSTI